MKTPKPEPVAVNIVCSLCELPWSQHGDDPTTLDCIRLLKQRNLYTPFPRPYWYTSTIHTGINTNRIAGTSSPTVTYMTPREATG